MELRVCLSHVPSPRKVKRMAQNPLEFIDGSFVTTMGTIQAQPQILIIRPEISQSIPKLQLLIALFATVVSVTAVPAQMEAKQVHCDLACLPVDCLRTESAYILFLPGRPRCDFTGLFWQPVFLCALLIGIRVLVRSGLDIHTILSAQNTMNACAGPMHPGMLAAGLSDRIWNEREPPRTVTYGAHEACIDRRKETDDGRIKAGWPFL
ncbi:hypothetical protein FB45DRAFT_864286 [Roridomyces roridus]|uniref:Uncharacterized protein n=1 Tax=Roridomyces roridus TaxID=1738132 RepID=A0AAD7C0Y7_9AGAR|nr:hypothetical protein FB45DRAFT_864286 [Roridomyces roridus]